MFPNRQGSAAQNARTWETIHETFVKYGSKCHSTKIASRYSTVDIMLTPKPIRERSILDRPHMNNPIEISLKSVLTSAHPDLFSTCRNQSFAHQEAVCIRAEDAAFYEPLTVEFIPARVENFTPIFPFAYAKFLTQYEDIMPSEIFKPNEAQTSEWLHRTENSPEPYENEPELLEYTVRFSHFVCSEYPIILKKLVTFNDNDNDQFEKLDLKLTNLLPEGQPAKIVSPKLKSSAHW